MEVIAGVKARKDTRRMAWIPRRCVEVDHTVKLTTVAIDALMA